MTSVPIVRYDNVHDVSLRLNGSVVRYKGRPVFVQVTGVLLTLNATDLVTRNTITVDANDPDLDISSPPLGYENLPKYPNYLYRSPHRRQTQGLVSSNVIRFDEWERRQIRSGELTSISVGKTILGEYPTVFEVVEKLNKDSNILGLAVSRKVALIRNVNKDAVKVRHSMETIGFLEGITPQVVLLPDFEENNIFRKDLSRLGFVVNG